MDLTVNFSSSRNALPPSAEILKTQFQIDKQKVKALRKAIRNGIVRRMGKVRPDNLPLCWSIVPAVPTINKGQLYSIGMELFNSLNYFVIELVDMKTDISIDRQVFLLTKQVRYMSGKQFCRFIGKCLQSFLNNTIPNQQASCENPMPIGLAFGLPINVKPNEDKPNAIILSTGEPKLPSQREVYSEEKDSVDFTETDLLHDHEDDDEDDDEDDEGFVMTEFVDKNFVEMLEVELESLGLAVKIYAAISDISSVMCHGIHKMQRNPEIGECHIALIANQQWSNIAFLESDKAFLERCKTDKNLLFQTSPTSSYSVIVDTNIDEICGEKSFAQIMNEYDQRLLEKENQNFSWDSFASGKCYPQLLHCCLNYLQAASAFSNTDVRSIVNPESYYQVFKTCLTYDTKSDKTYEKLAAELKPMLEVTPITGKDAHIIHYTCKAIIMRTVAILATGLAAVADRISVSIPLTKLVVATSVTLFDIVPDLNTLIEHEVGQLTASKTKFTLLSCTNSYGAAATAAAAADAARAQIYRSRVLKNTDDSDEEDYEADNTDAQRKPAVKSQGVY